MIRLKWVFLIGMLVVCISSTIAQPISDLTAVYRNWDQLLGFNWTSISGGYETLWRTPNPNHDGDPNNGQDFDWYYVTSVDGPAGQVSVTVPVDGDYANYVVVSDDQISNVCGHYRFTAVRGPIGVGASTAFGLPFKFWDVSWQGIPQHGEETTRPSDIIGDQIAPGDALTADKIIRQGGDQAYNEGMSGWSGWLETNEGMVPGGAYWYENKTGAPRDVVLTGEVDNTGDYGEFLIAAPDTAGHNFATPYSWRDSRLVLVEDLGLIEQGFTGGDMITSDKLVAQDGRLVNFIELTQQFEGGFETIVPGKAYWIINKHVGNDWTYNYNPAQRENPPH